MGIQKQLRILICPLDWGLGHTTRCVPILKHIIESGHTAVFAGNEWQRKYIIETFGNIETIHLEGYNVHYSKSGKGFIINLLAQIPNLLKTIRKEQQWLVNTVKKYRIDGVISDNRYGLYHSSIPSVIMTHQVLAQSGMGNIADNMLRKLHYKQLVRFERCWIVDVAGNPNLSGWLGHPKILPRNATYIGLLSQITQTETAEKYLMVLLSGPEPQRTMLSDILWQQVQGYKGKVVFVEGRDNTARNNIPDHITHYTRITKEVLQPLLQQAAMVICRSGYSTLMDLAVLKKKAILIATPGQTEQEYLATYLHKAGVFYATAQTQLQLMTTLEDVKHFPFKPLSFENGFDQYKAILDNWLATIKTIRGCL